MNENKDAVNLKKTISSSDVIKTLPYATSKTIGIILPMTEQSSAEPRYRDDENAWLITLPEKRNGAHFFQALTLVAIRTVSDVYYPAAVSVEDRSPRRLVRRECELKLYWRGGGWHQENPFWPVTPSIFMTVPPSLT
ncbi:hypothetical protein [Cronobacter malonaticus]|uniref:hypothetical protein n=1 Tax=Cronobacter malonaticus TaxID=413503 RepID=UPI0035172A08